MNNGKYEFLIVGSGAGGATLAKELSKKLAPSRIPYDFMMETN